VCDIQEVNDEMEQELAATRHKLSTLESDSQKHISELENQLADALSSAAAAGSAGELH